MVTKKRKPTRVKILGVDKETHIIKLQEPLRMKIGSTVKLLKPEKPWAPFSFAAIPAGTHGKVLDMYQEGHYIGREGKKLVKKLSPYIWVRVKFNWVDSKGITQSDTLTFSEDNPKLGVVQYEPSSEPSLDHPENLRLVEKDTARRQKNDTPIKAPLRISKRPTRITPKMPRLRR